MPVVSDAFDAAALVEAVVAFATDLVMHQLTDLPDHLDRVPDDAPHYNRIRTEGTRNLLAGTAAAGARRFLAQGIAWTPPGSGTANADHERLALDAGGVVVLLVEDDEDPRSTRHEARGSRPLAPVSPNLLASLAEQGVAPWCGRGCIGRGDQRSRMASTNPVDNPVGLDMAGPWRPPTCRGERPSVAFLATHGGYDLREHWLLRARIRKRAKGGEGALGR